MYSSLKGTYIVGNRQPILGRRPRRLPLGNIVRDCQCTPYTRSSYYLRNAQQIYTHFDLLQTNIIGTGSYNPHLDVNQQELEQPSPFTCTYTSDTKRRYLRPRLGSSTVPQDNI